MRETLQRETFNQSLDKRTLTLEILSNHLNQLELNNMIIQSDQAYFEVVDETSSSDAHILTTLLSTLIDLPMTIKINDVYVDINQEIGILYELHISLNNLSVESSQIIDISLLDETPLEVYEINHLDKKQLDKENHDVYIEKALSQIDEDIVKHYVRGINMNFDVYET